MQKKTRLFIQDNYKYAILFIVFAALCWLFPYSGDDWAWGSSIGIERLNTWFDNYSGRYFGNLIVLALTRSNLLKSVVMSFCLTGIVFLIERITKQKSGFFISLILILLLPKLVLRQAIVWTSGFANYTTSIFLTLIYIYYIYWIFDAKTDIEATKLKQHPLHAVLLLVLGFGNTLIVEHLTLYNVLLSLFVLGFVLIKFKKVLIQHFSYAIGSFLGTITMFSNSCYRSISNNEDDYRSVSSSLMGLLESAKTNYFDVIYKSFYNSNIFLLLTIIVICCLLFYYTKDSLSKRWQKILATVSLAVVISYNIYAIMTAINLNTFDVGLGKLKYLEGLCTAICYACLAVFLLIIAAQYKKALKILFIGGSAAALVAPLLVVNPIGDRCFFASYVILVLLIVELIGLLPTKVTEKLESTEVKAFATILIAGLFVFYFSIFIPNHKTDIERSEYIEQQIAAGETKIEIVNLPYESYVWFPTPGNKLWKYRYKLFHDIPQEIELVRVKYYTDKNVDTE